MSPEQEKAIERIRELLPKITGGPWTMPAWPTMQPPILAGMRVFVCETRGCREDSRDNAEFIALTRNTIEPLLTTLDQQRERIRLAEKLLRAAQNDIHTEWCDMNDKDWQHDKCKAIAAYFKEQSGEE